MLNPFAIGMPSSYLFSEIARRVASFQENHGADGPRVIRMGIGDVTRPLPRACVEAMKSAADEQLSAATFRGYPPDGGYDFLRNAIAGHEYRQRGVDIPPDDIFISDGAKSDSANIQELFDNACVVGVTDPVYPVYVDSNAWAGRLGNYTDGKWDKLVTFPCSRDNDYVASPPDKHVDLIYLCFPNNPTGIAATAKQLREWVDYANRHGAVIVYDAAYRAYITDPGIPRTIYEIDGAKTCAIEICSFSKTAGFTGTRCSWTVVPRELYRDGASLRALWSRRQATKFNGAPYIVQRGAEAVYSPEGQADCAATIAYYSRNARKIRQTLEDAGIEATGGVNAPYVWMRCPDNMDSWTFFDFLLKEARVVGTPGSGFGRRGEGYFRLTAFGSHEDTDEAMDRVRSLPRKL
ncbi:MAG: LL-diaminopimelate aminotransferase [Oscillospiraceae bacterium]|jgi:LL-diaminopimelate aminotransferase|nr:LL-diaminopimelate aminotransferase [Oscillospiraceae bacterium]